MLDRPKVGTHWLDKKGRVYRIRCVTDDDVVVYHDAYRHITLSKNLDRWHRDMLHLKSKVT